MKTLLAILSIAVLAGATQAKADNIETLPQYTGGYYIDPGPYQPSTVIGTFDILAGYTTLTISGDFGNSVVPSSAGVDLYLGDVLVGTCVENYPCWNAITPWSDTLTATQIASLGTGIVDFTAVQTSQYVIQLGETTLDQGGGTSVTPEPSGLLLLATGLLGFAGVVRRRLNA